MKISIDLLTDNGLRIGSSASINLSDAEAKALSNYLTEKEGFANGSIAAWAKAAVEIALEANGALDGIPQQKTPDFLIKDEGEFALVYPQNEKAMAFLKSMKSAHWYSEKSIAISADNVRNVTRVFESADFSVEGC